MAELIVVGFKKDMYRASEALNMLEAIMQVPDKAIPRDLLANARAIGVFPQVVKARALNRHTSQS